MTTAKSYSNIHGEWENRKISLWGAAKSFISQLRVGQDMTRISMPALFCRPYSILEEVATRNLSTIQLITEAPTLPGAEERMRSVLAWFLSNAREENFNHKPYNPVIGEEHKAFVQLPEAEVFFLSEQVRHHPPISAFQTVIPKVGVAIEGNTNFSVTFNGNSVTVSMLGEMRVKLTLPSGEEEVYRLSKCAPDILIQNVILGTKHIYWHGDLSIVCETTGYSVDLVFGADKAKNPIQGTLKKGADPVGYIRGVAGHAIYLAKDAKMKDQELLCDVATLQLCDLQYPKVEDLKENNSIRLWSEVSKALIENDMNTADQKKGEIEEAERVKRKENETAHETAYFHEISENIWQVKDPLWYEKSPDINPHATVSNEE